MSNLQNNNIDSFSFTENYNACHGFNQEFSDIQDPTVPPIAIPQANPFIQPVNGNSHQINILKQSGNAQFVNENIQPVDLNAQPINTNNQPKNTNAQLDNMNQKPKNMNAHPVDMNAQIDNQNGQVKNNNINNPELNLAIIFKSMSQVMQQYLAEKSLQKYESDQQLS